MSESDQDSPGEKSSTERPRVAAEENSAAAPRTKPDEAPDASEAPRSDEEKLDSAGQLPAKTSGVDAENPDHGEVFSPARALEAVGDRWSLLLYRESMFGGTTRFDHFQEKFDVPSDVLDARLTGFVGAGLMELRRTDDDEEHFEYVLTPRGHNLEPVITALCTWTDGWAMNPGPAIPFAHDKQITDAIHDPDDHTGHEDGADGDPADDAAADQPLQTTICLLRGFDFQIGGKSLGSLAAGSQRLLAFVALHSTTVARDTVAGKMWPESTEQKAGISLRSALSRLDTESRNAILSASAGLRLVETVAVDFRQAQEIAGRLLKSSPQVQDSDLDAHAVALLSSDLLPDWYDDWVVSEAEDWLMMRMNALEVQSAELLKRKRYAAAAGSARAAVNAEPLRESATASLIRVHLAEGNQSDALRIYNRYRVLLRKVLNLEPTAALTELVANIQQN
ncbi:MAG: winged helix-turn-helix transcriptional regulator [Kineosporiaceae bacterium]|nr:winged helix-turn-helix transcriptional regulator [Aeromicrobium sp.]